MNAKLLKDRFLDKIGVFLRQIARRLEIEGKTEKKEENTLYQFEKDDYVQRRGAPLERDLGLLCRQCFGDGILLRRHHRILSISRVGSSSIFTRICFMVSR